MTWDESKLDQLAVDMRERVVAGLAEEAAENAREDGSTSMCIGFWMHRLLECKQPSRRQGAEA